MMGLCSGGFCLERYFRTAGDEGGTASVEDRSIGDVRALAMFTGISEVNSTGIRFGVSFQSDNSTSLFWTGTRNLERGQQTCF